MDRFEILEKKVLQAAEQLAALRQERRKLLAELEFLQEENKRAQELVRINEAMRDEKKILANRIEKIIKKISSIKFGN